MRVLRALPVSALTLNLSLGSDLSVIFCEDWWGNKKRPLMGKLLMLRVKG